MPSAYLTQKTEGHISVYPARDLTFHPVNHLAFGDLHGNALKFIFLLLRTGIMELKDSKDYRHLNVIYHAHSLNDQQINEFIEILDNAAINNQKHLTLIGDELCDRGNNDWLTLLIFERLNKAKLSFDVVLSNHSLGFIEYYESGTKHILSNYDSQFIASLEGLKTLIAKKIVTKEALEERVQNDYIPLVKAISYTYAPESISAPNKLTIYTHAPSSLRIIAYLAEVLRLTYDHTTPESLMRSIDDINFKITTLLKNKSLAREIKQNNALYKAMDYLVFHRDFIPQDHCIPRNAEVKYDVKFVHGHIGADLLFSCKNSTKPSPLHTNLDNDFGKKLPHDSNHCGEYVIGYTWQLTAKQLACVGV